jgi:phosphoribosylanthranilate isomerase
MTKIKICGLSRKVDIIYANKLLPDYIGFVFAKSKRQVTRTKAQELRKLLSPKIKAVGVFVKEEVTQIAKVANDGIIDAIQLHSDETPEFCQMLKLLTKVPVIKVLRIKEAADLKKLERFACDYFLLDTYGAGQYGGTGQTFDYRLLQDAVIPKPYFIAGGLDATNVHKIIQATHPYGVDVSGGVETDDYKDFAKMQEFVLAVRGGNEND